MGGRWTKAGCLYDELGRWSIAWRVHDAQFWGVPQRRKRIALVADFGGLTATEILFERKGLQWDSVESGEKGKGTAEKIETGTTSTGKCLNPWDVQSKHIQPANGKVETLYAGECRYGGGESYVFEDHGQDTRHKLLGNEGVASTITASYGTKWNGNAGAYSGENFVIYDARGNEDGAISLTMMGNHNAHVSEIYTTSKNEFHTKALTNIATTLVASDYKDPPTITKVGERTDMDGIVRRLIPLECERLQGFPDGWTDIGDWTDSSGKKHKLTDSNRYKALGNSIALPFWFYLMRRISAQYERPATLGSLFDGIGGFPLCWTRCNGPDTAVWSSEIDEFCTAVTNYHFNMEKDYLHG